MGSLLASVEACLEEANLRHCLIHVRLSNDLARFAHVPWAAGIATEEDLYACAEMAIAPVLGDDLSRWTLRVSSGRVGQARIACALPTALLDGVRAHIRRFHCLSGSIRPLLPLVLKPWMGRGLPPSRILTCVENDVCHAVALERNEAQWIRRFEGFATVVDLLQAVERQQLMHGLAMHGDVYSVVIGDRGEDPAWDARFKLMRRVLPSGMPLQAMLAVTG